ncbi:MAG: heme-binding domain-containing protein [Bacteroidota bacterium]
MKKVLYVIVILLVIIQFIPSGLPDISKDNPNDLLVNNTDIPKDVQMILKTSCYDCHSNETYYPWYSYIAPISFLVSRDTKVGREKFNFSDWTTYKKSDMAEILDEISEEVSEGEMPMKIYTIIHRDASLSDDEKEIIVNWADEFVEKIFD